MRMKYQKPDFDCEEIRMSRLLCDSKVDGDLDGLVDETLY